MKIELSEDELSRLLKSNQNLVDSLCTSRAEEGRLISEKARLGDTIYDLRMQIQNAKDQPTLSHSEKMQPLLKALITACLGGGYETATGSKESWARCNKIGAIKVVREMTGLGLREAKDLVESCVPKEKPSVG